MSGLAAAAPEGMPRVAIIGAGSAGRQFTRRCLQAGFSVVLEDVLPEKLRRIQVELADDPPAQRVGTLHLATTVEEAVRNADIAIDFVPDELESKLEIFSLLDRMAPPRAILLTPTEVLSIADLASCTYRASLCFGLRGLSPALAEGRPLQVLYPPVSDVRAQSLVSAVFGRMGLPIALALDETPSELTRGLPA